MIAIAISISANAKNQAFSVDNIAINETYADLSNAREQALDQATKKAFEQLLARLSTQSLHDINLDEINPSTYVSTYDIKHEKMSRKHYEAEFSFQFNPVLIRQFFKTHHIAYSEIQAKPILIIPVYNNAGTTIVWEEKTEWFKSWQNYSSDGQKLSIIVPHGDIHDLTKLSTQDIRHNDMHAFRNIMAHYHTSMILITEIQPLSATNIVVKNKLYNTTKLLDESRLEVTVTDSMDKTYEDIQAYILKDLWNFRKDTTVISDHQERAFKTSITINSLQNLVDLEKKLQSLSIVKSYNIDNISENQVSLTIYYIGSEDTLREHIFSF